MTVKELLAQSKEKIRNPRHWLRGSLVQKRNPLAYGEEGDEYCFCARGALYDTACGGQLVEIYGQGSHRGNSELDAIMERPDVVQAEALLNTCAVKVEPDLGGDSSPITRLNDRMGTHADVLAAFDCAIEKA